MCIRDSIGSASNNLLFLQHGQATCTSSVCTIVSLLELLISCMWFTSKKITIIILFERKGIWCHSLQLLLWPWSLGQWSRFSDRYRVKYPLLHNSLLIISCLFSNMCSVYSIYQLMAKSKQFPKQFLLQKPRLTNAQQILMLYDDTPRLSSSCIKQPWVLV